LYPKVVYLQCRYHPNMRVYPHCVYKQVKQNVASFCLTGLGLRPKLDSWRSVTSPNFGFAVLLNAIRKLLRNFANPSPVI